MPKRSKNPRTSESLARHLADKQTVESAQTGSGAEPEKYPLMGNTGKRLERKALSQGWMDLVDENAVDMVQRQIDDAKDTESTPRDRRGAFNAVMGAKHREENNEIRRESIEIQKLRVDVVLFPQQQESETVEGSVMSPELVAEQLLKMQSRIAQP